MHSENKVAVGSQSNFTVVHESDGRGEEAVLVVRNSGPNGPELPA